MAAELLALTAAFCFASGQITVKLATQSGNIVFGLLITLATGVVAVGALAAVVADFYAVSVGAVALFALSGLVGPGAGRIISMRAIRDIGTSVAVPVQSSSYPLLASAAAVVLFGEVASIDRALGVGLIITGIWLCIRGGPANRAMALAGSPARRGTVGRFVLTLPLLAGAAYAIGDILTKLALAKHGDPILGAFIGLGAAFVVWLTVFLAVEQFRERVRITPSFIWFCVSGLLSATALVSLLFALRIGELSVVAPIVASQPVIVIILGALLLRDFEKLRVGTILGAVLVFLGVAYLSTT